MLEEEINDQEQLQELLIELEEKQMEGYLWE